MSQNHRTPRSSDRLPRRVPPTGQPVEIDETARVLVPQFAVIGTPINPGQRPSPPLTSHKSVLNAQRQIAGLGINEIAYGHLKNHALG